MNYYEILEIKEEASAEVIKAAYKALSKKYHPDICGVDSSKFKKTMTEINTAYETLSDDSKRKAYDATLKQQQQTSGNSSENWHYDENKDSKADDDDFGSGIETPAGKVKRFFRSVGKEIQNQLQKNVQERDNAFIDGSTMDDYALFRRYRQATGAKRIGYALAMEEKGLLYRDSDGNLKPSETLKRLI